MDDAHRTLEDFLLDDRFVHWVTNPTPALDRYWANWQGRYPQQQPLVEQARLVIQEARASAHHAQLSDEEVETMWQQLQTRHRATDRPVTVRRIPGWLRVAASLAGIALACLMLYQWYASGKTVTYRTAYGETQTIVLPDSSTVMLNANSTLSHPTNWNNRQDRRVTLLGEAYFDVRHTRNHRKFLVQTNAVVVEVVGTSFNVQQRRNRAQVVLSEGKVTLYPSHRSDTDHITMQPGELVEINATNFSQKQVDVTEYTAWINDALRFNGTPLAEIAQLLEDNYGLQVQLADSSLARKRFRGRVASDDIPGLLGQLEKVFQLTIEQKGNEVIVCSRAQSKTQDD